MIVTTSNGKVYRIQFVHSPHDLKHLHPGTPGGLRQFVDNLALSLRRRVTLCEIAVWTGEEKLNEQSLAELAEEGVERWSRVFEPISQGFAICHYIDQFNKAQGRARALDRALHVCGLDKAIQNELADTYCSLCK